MRASMQMSPWIERLHPLRSFLSFLLICCVLSACQSTEPSRLVDARDTLPPLEFSMTDVNSGEKVTAPQYKGKIVLLFFGYTFCPDVCPTTLATLSQVMEQMKDVSGQISILFVTVDPDRDTAEYLKAYLESFSARATGLLGTPNELADLARRYRVAYTVNAGSDPKFYTMNHTATLFIFDQDGELTSLAPYGTSAEDIEHDLRMLMEKSES